MKWQMILIYTTVSSKNMFRQAKLVAFCYQLNVFPNNLGNLLQRLPHKVSDSRPDIYISPFNDLTSLPPFTTHWRREKMADIFIRHFNVHFPHWKLLHFDSISVKFVPIYLGAQQAKRHVMWTHDGIVYWRIYAPVGLNKLRSFPRTCKHTCTIA